MLTLGLHKHKHAWAPVTYALTYTHKHHSIGSWKAVQSNSQPFPSFLLYDLFMSVSLGTMAPVDEVIHFSPHLKVSITCEYLGHHSGLSHPFPKSTRSGKESIHIVAFINEQLTSKIISGQRYLIWFRDPRQYVGNSFQEEARSQWALLKKLLRNQGFREYQSLVFLHCGSDRDLNSESLNSEI